MPTKSIGTGQFVIGSSKVRPRLSEQFKRDEKMGIYVQLYNFEPDEKTQKPDGTIEYEVLKNGSNQKVFEFAEEIGKTGKRIGQSGYGRKGPSAEEPGAWPVYDPNEGDGPETQPDREPIRNVHGAVN